MANSPWKETERRTARLLGGQRVGCTGKATPDVVAGWLVAECKHRKTLPQWIAHALAQARTAAGATRLGVAVLHGKGARDSWVVLSLADWLAWFGDAPGGDGPGGET